MEKIKWLELGCFDVGIRLGVTNSPEAFQSEMKKMKITDNFFPSDSAYAASNFYTGSEGNQTIIITTRKDRKWRGQKLTWVQIAGLCAHEAVHAVRRICDTLEIGTEEDECRAYLTEYITQELFLLFDR